jgi:hypothetical protein
MAETSNPFGFLSSFTTGGGASGSGSTGKPYATADNLNLSPANMSDPGLGSSLGWNMFQMPTAPGTTGTTGTASGGSTGKEGTSGLSNIASSLTQSGLNTLFPSGNVPFQPAPAAPAPAPAAPAPAPAPAPAATPAPTNQPWMNQELQYSLMSPAQISAMSPAQALQFMNSTNVASIASQWSPQQIAALAGIQGMAPYAAEIQNYGSGPAGNQGTD